MKVDDWFSLGVRVVGITVLIAGLGVLLDSLLLKLGYFNLLDTHPPNLRGRPADCGVVSDPGRTFSCRLCIPEGR